MRNDPPPEHEDVWRTLRRRVVKSGIVDARKGKPFRPQYDVWGNVEQSDYEFGRQFVACGENVDITLDQWNAMFPEVEP
jgi:hypothetical protein